jgi:AhpD family alkylhydroperoxidase
MTNAYSRDFPFENGRIFISRIELGGLKLHRNADVQVKHVYWNLVVNEAEPLAIPLPNEAVVSQLIGASYDGARTLNAVKMLAGAGDLARPAIDLMHAIFETTTVDSKTRELIIVRTAKAVGCEYALRAGAVIAANTGLTADEISAAKGDAYDGALTPEYMLLCQVVDELSISGNLSDSTLSALLARYDSETCRKLVLMVCWFNLVNRFENGCRVPFDPPSLLAAMTSPQA